jgi:hypothetical protein
VIGCQKQTKGGNGPPQWPMQDTYITSSLYEDEVIFITNGFCTAHITVTEKARYTPPPTNVNGERMHNHTKPQEHLQMGYMRRQKQQVLPGGWAGFEPAMVRTQLGTCPRAKQGKNIKVAPHRRRTRAK